MENGSSQKTYDVCKTECQCDGPGECPVYGIYMNERRYERCKHDCSWRKQYARYYAKLNIADIKQELENRMHNAMSEEQKEIDEAEKQLDNTILEIEKEGVTLQNYQQKTEGLGDLVEGVLSKIGISEETIKKWSGIGGCGCHKRKKFLNQILPFRKKE